MCITCIYIYGGHVSYCDFTALKIKWECSQRYEINHEQLIKNVCYASLEASVIYLHPGLQWSLLLNSIFLHKFLRDIRCFKHANKLRISFKVTWFDNDSKLIYCLNFGNTCTCLLHYQNLKLFCKFPITYRTKLNKFREVYSYLLEDGFKKFFRCCFSVGRLSCNHWRKNIKITRLNKGDVFSVKYPLIH